VKCRKHSEQERNSRDSVKYRTKSRVAKAASFEVTSRSCPGPGNAVKPALVYNGALMWNKRALLITILRANSVGRVRIIRRCTVPNGTREDHRITILRSSESDLCIDEHCDQLSK
jgi:hypothetical protein